MDKMGFTKELREVAARYWEWQNCLHTAAAIRSAKNTPGPEKTINAMLRHIEEHYEEVRAGRYTSPMKAGRSWWATEDYPSTAYPRETILVPRDRPDKDALLDEILDYVAESPAMADKVRRYRDA